MPALPLLIGQTATYSRWYNTLIDASTPPTATVIEFSN